MTSKHYCPAIVEALEVNTSLKTFNFDNVTPGNVHAIAAALAANRGLKRVYLEVGNDTDLEVITRALNSDNTLQSVNLTITVEESSIRTVADFICSNAGRKALHINYQGRIGQSNLS